MVEISEKELARRKAERAAKKTKSSPAQSFRLGEEHVERLRVLAQRSDLAQVDLLRDLIDQEWIRATKARKKRELTLAQ